MRLLTMDMMRLKWIHSEIDRNGDDCVFQNRNRKSSGLLLADQLKMKRELPLCVEVMGDDADIIVEIHSLSVKLSYSICEGDRKVSYLSL